MARFRTPNGEERGVQSLTHPGADATDAAMERYAHGDNAAFAEVYDALAPRLLGVLRKATRDGAAAEDLVQQTFLQIHRARGSFIPGAPVMPWAFAIAKRLMIDRGRRQRIELSLFKHPAADDDDFMLSAPSATPATDELLHARRMARRIQQRLDTLPETQRTAYQLVKQEGVSLKRAAELLGTSVTAIKLRTHRAYQALRAVLREEGDAA